METARAGNGKDLPVLHTSLAGLIFQQRSKLQLNVMCHTASTDRLRWGNIPHVMGREPMTRMLLFCHAFSWVLIHYLKTKRKMWNNDLDTWLLLLSLRLSEKGQG